MRYLFALFLLAHGLIHASWLSPPPADTGGPAWPFDLTKSPILSPFGVSESALRVAGTSLVVVAVAGFVLSALGAAGVPGLAFAWTTITVGASVASLAVIALFWNVWFPVGVLIDLALIVTALNQLWPATLVK